MNSHAIAPNSEAAILARTIQAHEPVVPEVARYLLSFTFQSRDVERMNELAQRAQGGQLTEEEHRELESYLHVSNLLVVMQSHARQVLNSEPRPER
jgi:hypothetical protein